MRASRFTLLGGGEVPHALEATLAAVVPDAGVGVGVPPTGALGAGLSVVATQPAAAELDLVELLDGLDGAFDVVEVGVREATRPARRAVDGDPDVLDVLQRLEHGVEVRVRRLVRDVTDEYRRRRLLSATPSAFRRRLLTRLHVDAAAVPERPVGALDGALGGFLIREPDEAETAMTR